VADNARLDRHPTRAAANPSKSVDARGAAAAEDAS
jgi:hypothetical protein